MLRVRWVVIGVVLAGWGAGAFAQESESAEALLTRSYETLTGLPHLEVTISMRSLRAVQDPRSGGAGGLRMLNEDYQQVRVTRRQPDDWRLVSQRERVQNGQVLPERKLVFSKVGNSSGAVLMLNVTTKELVTASIPDGLFRQEILERAGVALRSDPVLGALLFDRENTGGRAFGLENVSRAGPDEANGVRLTRLSAQKRGFGVSIWIDDATGLITRALVTGPAMGMMRQVSETIYTYDLGRGAEAWDFDSKEGWASAKGDIATTAGFTPVADVFAITGTPLASAEQPPGLRPQGRPETPGAAGAGAVAAKTPGSGFGEEQLLTPQQMEAIVLVEGDDGVGSGFVARLRGVDFVVTNQHVIGGNAKIRVTTLRGAPVKVGTMFGALGRDIAILRIEGENTVPPLKIADDPVKTVKLGDKVAVVGNRRGGGVATQVSGVVRGIGPDKIEVDAPFQPGNSGSPIVHVASGEVIGLATYSMTRRLDALDGGDTGAAGARASGAAQTEQRWFGYRPDGVTKWETIDLDKWRAQAKRISDFEAESQAIYWAMKGGFKQASGNARIRPLVARLEERVARQGSSQVVVAQEVQEFFCGLRAIADSGARDLKSGDYYDFFRTSLYWDTSLTEQLRAREELVRGLEKAADNTTAFLEKLRR